MKYGRICAGVGPTVPLEILICGEEVSQGWVPLYHQGGIREEA